MIEMPLVLIDVQRGGPSTGLPTKVEQSDLLAALFGQPGDAPHVIMAPATIEECFQVMITARRIAETFRDGRDGAVGRQSGDRSDAVPRDRRPTRGGRRRRSTWHRCRMASGPTSGIRETGLSRRFIPGQAGRDAHRHRAVARRAQQGGVQLGRASARRRRCAAASWPCCRACCCRRSSTVSRRAICWSWGGGARRARSKRRWTGRGRDGGRVSSLHLRFLSPLEPGLTAIFRRFRQVLTVEINYSDDPDDPFITEENRRRGQLSMLLRNATLVDVDCWTRVPGEPLRAGRRFSDAIAARMAAGGCRHDGIVRSASRCSTRTTKRRHTS